MTRTIDHKLIALIGSAIVSGTISGLAAAATARLLTHLLGG
jgi:hypothetical protein